jgi:hypothetical protein
MTPSHVTGLAKNLADRLQEDIEKCVTREDHIRVTARANEALHLLHGLNQLIESSGLAEEDLQTDSSPQLFDTSTTNPGLVA